jgi:ABC-2 type transport system ATP-binding protein
MGLRKLLPLAVLVALAAPATAAAEPTVEDGKVITSFDGTPIVATLMLPEGASAQKPAPVILITHGWGGTRTKSPGGFSQRLLDSGYAILSWDQRGFGESGGTVQIDDPDFEARDVVALIDFLAKDARIARDKPGDPKVGMSGGSYAGGIQFITAARDKRIDAIAPEIAWNNLLESLVPEGTLKIGWGLLLTGAGETSLVNGLNPQNAAGPQTESYPVEIYKANAEGTATGDFGEDTKAWFAHKGPDYLLDKIDAPTFILQATTDTLFPLSQAVDNYATLSRTLPPSKLKMAWYCGGHGSCAPFSSGPSGYAQGLILKWFDRWVRDAKVETGPGFEYLDGQGTWHQAKEYPVPGAKAKTGSGAGVVTVQGEPSSSGLMEGSAPRTALTIPLADGAGTLVGAPKVSFTATGAGAATDQLTGTTLFFQLIDTTTGDVLGNLVTPKPIATDATAHKYEFTIEPVSFTATNESRLALQVVSAAVGYEANRGAAVVQLDDIEVSVPVAPAAKQARASRR